MIGSALTKSSDKILDDIGYVNETIIPYALLKPPNDFT